jgi:hypothetical protein
MSMRVEFHAADVPDTVVATAAWDGSAVTVEADDPAVRATLEQAFRPMPVVVDDGAYRRQGTRGEVQVQPGSLEWFRAVAQVRAPSESGLAARLVPGITEGGYDPAAQYRTFEESIDRLSAGRG